MGGDQRLAVLHATTSIRAPAAKLSERNAFLSSIDVDRIEPANARERVAANPRIGKGRSSICRGACGPSSGADPTAGTAFRPLALLADTGDIPTACNGRCARAHDPRKRLTGRQDFIRDGTCASGSGCKGGTRSVPSPSAIVIVVTSPPQERTGEMLPR